VLPGRFTAAAFVCMTWGAWRGRAAGGAGRGIAGRGGAAVFVCATGGLV
jgi:hypothetical protein